MTDIFGVKCDLPEPPTRLGDYDHEGTPATGLLISVSNDGFNASVQKLRHVSYDSKCMNCSNSSNCELKVGGKYSYLNEFFSPLSGIILTNLSNFDFSRIPV